MEATRDPTKPAPKTFEELETDPNRAIEIVDERAVVLVSISVPGGLGSSGSEIFRETDSDEVEQVSNDNMGDTGYSGCVFRDHIVPVPFVCQF